MCANYHSFTLFASNFRKINNNKVKAIKLDPPYEKKGNGTPMVGKIPINMEMLTKKCMNKMAATQYP